MDGPIIISNSIRSSFFSNRVETVLLKIPPTSPLHPACTRPKTNFDLWAKKTGMQSAT